ncbi:MAG: histidinol-phosphate transaminase [Rickettsiella sp.]|nr:histidinol-phosphate transaminase [Rickettsiella sp.]
MTMIINKNSNHYKEHVCRPIKLDRNENPLGPSPLAIKAANRALSRCHQYPENEELALKRCLAKHLGISPKTIALANGSERLLELIAKIYLTPGDSAVLPNYSFINLTKIIETTGAELRVASNSHEDIKVSQILEVVNYSTKIIFIVNPNNPTSTYINTTNLIYLLNEVPSHKLIVIDEAYAEYVQASDYPDTIKLINKYPNLIICRTFSKFYGLAGLRLGYAITTPKIVDILNQSSLPFSVNSIALAAAQEAILDKKHIKSTKSNNKKACEQLTLGLKKLSLIVHPSFTNFVCVDLKHDSLDVYRQLLKVGIRVRTLHDYGLPTHLRISMGLEEQNQQLLDALSKIPQLNSNS